MAVPEKKISVLLVDDHTLMREGLRMALAQEGGVRIAGEASDGNEALRQARALSPDVILMDIRMPGADGVSAIKEILKEQPRAKIIAVSMHDESHYVQQAVRAGARGYVLKDASSRELVRAIRDVNDGETFFSPRVSRFLLNDYVAGGARRRHSRLDLSLREREVLVLIAQGWTVRRISEKLQLASRTVNTYRERLMEKLDIRGAAGLTRYAVSQGLVDAGPAVPPSRRQS